MGFNSGFKGLNTRRFVHTLSLRLPVSYNCQGHTDYVPAQDSAARRCGGDAV